jgi:hypothetical protein
MVRRILVATVFATLSLPTGVLAQDGAIRWRAFRGAIEIPRPDADPLKLRVEIPDQMITGGRLRVVLRGPDPQDPPVAAYGRLLTADDLTSEQQAAAGGGSDVAMEDLQLAAEGLRIETSGAQAAREGRIMVLAYTHEIAAPRDPSPTPNSGVEIPLPGGILK